MKTYSNFILSISFILFFINNLIFAQTICPSETAPKKIIGNIGSYLEKYGFTAEIDYTSDLLSNASGGVENKLVYTGNVNFKFNLQLGKTLQWEGAKIYGSVLGVHGDIPSDYSGTLQGTSNIAAERQFKLYELWLEQELFSQKLSVLVGLFDLNSEFDCRETSSIFINPSHGIGAEYALTGTEGPSIFPNTHPAVRIKYDINENFRLKSSVFKGSKDSYPVKDLAPHLHVNKNYLFATEFSIHSKNEELSKDYYNFFAGAWYYTAQFEKHNFNETESTGIQEGNIGLYLSLEKFLIEESAESNEGLSGFFRIGLADDNVNKLDGYLGFGFNYKGLIPGRDEDIIGIALAHSHLSNGFRNLNSELNGRSLKSYESILELTYKFSPAEFLFIQPDIQYAFYPVNCCNNNHALTIGIRAGLSI